MAVMMLTYARECNRLRGDFPGLPPALAAALRA